MARMADLPRRGIAARRKPVGLRRHVQVDSKIRRRPEGPIRTQESDLSPVA